MKLMDILALISGGIGVLIVIIAAISVVIGRNIFGFTHLVNYFHAANSFLLISVVLFLAGKRIDAGK
ncbi:MAG TPA: hypothetical protein P5320_05635 [Bacteroidales bacterium]|nr:hypothetical protein [Bacteroidales bacterium]HOK74988.1 hypothetical protein [Bacteroidales bacterium]HOM41262.1 hypothetical protein [Bacteroidales bacterium]HPP93352.1 hypothetical protein [Bacteroidales bacterium]HQG56399.1 hypothetical protein [Bacteroidales bacterium]